MNDLDDCDFEYAVIEIIKNVERLYPDDNLLAMVRNTAKSHKKTQIEKTEKIENHVCDPPPKEWFDVKEKLKNKFLKTTV